MKKIILSLVLGALSLSAAAAEVYGVTPTLVGPAFNGSTIFIGMATNTAGCLYSGVYFDGTTIEDRKAVLGVALAAKLAGKTVRMDYTQPDGPGTKCVGYSIYVE